MNKKATLASTTTRKQEKMKEKKEKKKQDEIIMTNKNCVIISFAPMTKENISLSSLFVVRPLLLPFLVSFRFSLSLYLSRVSLSDMEIEISHQKLRHIRRSSRAVSYGQNSGNNCKNGIGSRTVIGVLARERASLMRGAISLRETVKMVFLFLSTVPFSGEAKKKSRVPSRCSFLPRLSLSLSFCRPGSPLGGCCRRRRAHETHSIVHAPSER